MPAILGTRQACIGHASQPRPSTRRSLVIAHSHRQQSQQAQPQHCTHAAEVRRRGLLTAAGTLLLGLAHPSQRAVAEAMPNAVQPMPTGLSASSDQFKTLTYPTLAFAFDYPVATAQGSKLPIVLSRKPERYSSAAPLTPDARQRIVAELVDLPDAVTYSMSVGPPAPSIAKRTPEQWQPKEVAEAVLADRSTSRVTSGQRASMSQVETVRNDPRDSQDYIVYEFYSQGAPSTFRPDDRESYRHGLAVTAWRLGTKNKVPYLYTLMLTAPQTKWSELQPVFEHAVSSFRLLPPTKKFVTPEADPWLFF